MPIDLVTVPACTLDEAGVREQRARYARLADSVVHTEREPEALLVEFGEDLDRDTLEDALAVERDCCPFFVLDFDGARRRLRVAVNERAQLPAIDAIAFALGVAERI